MAVNRCERRVLGGIARQHHVESVLGRENIYYIPEDPNAMEAVNTGTPMGQGRSTRGFGKGIAALAGFCAGARKQNVAAEV